VKFARIAWVTAALAASFVARVAEAQEELAGRADPNAHATVGMAEFGVGLLSLPNASVCGSSTRSECSKGDNSVALSAWPLFRWGHFATGAGVMLGLTSSTDAPRNDPPDVPRDHTRRYFAVEITGRYYVPITGGFEGWVGITSGLGVVNDTFQSQQGLTDQALIGQRGITLLTQGYTLGLGFGLDAPIAANWLIGGRARIADWFLPGTSQTDPFEDTASLRGVVTTVDISLTIAYRSRLLF